MNLINSVRLLLLKIETFERPFLVSSDNRRKFSSNEFRRFLRNLNTRILQHLLNLHGPIIYGKDALQC